MKNKLYTILSTIILLTFSTASYANVYYWKVISVTDGDTLRVDPEFLPKELKLSVRIKDIDTPEKGSRAKCQEEKDLAARATAFTKRAIKNAQEISFRSIKWDKYGGRVLANVAVDNKDLGGLLIVNGLARPYYGKKKEGWCK